MKRYIQFLKNKYFIAIAIFTIWMTFFDPYNLRTQWYLNQEIIRLSKQLQFYQQINEQLRKERQLLTSSKAALESYAREYYLFKKENEDLYLIEWDSTKTLPWKEAPSTICR